MKDFQAFPDTYREVDGEIVPSYEPGNGNEPKYQKPRTVFLPCVYIHGQEELCPEE